MILQEAIVFQKMLNHIQRLEEELRQLKLETLKKEIHSGIEQIRNGEYSEYKEDSLSDLVEEIKSEGRQYLANRGIA